MRRHAWVVVLVLWTSTAHAEERVTAGAHTFSDSEDNRVETYTVEWLHSMRRDWRTTVRAALDRVVLPPLPGLPGSQENVDAITAASRPVASAELSKQGYAKLRQELNGQVEWTPAAGRMRTTGSAYYSHESDYIGRQLGLGLAHDFREGNTNLAVGLSHGFDTIAPEPHEGVVATEHERFTEDLTCVWTQTVSQRARATVGFEGAWVHGFQSNPYRRVYAGGELRSERHPERRFRRSLFGQYDRYFATRASVSLSGRWYSDDWGVQAGTFDAHLNQYVGEHLIVRYRYRHHLQSAASFQRDLYESADGVDGYLTADYKLDDFASNLFGVKLSVPFAGFDLATWARGVVLDVKFERYFDSKSFAANVFETGFTWPF